jgi:two-component system cell cycle response regulator DivK
MAPPTEPLTVTQKRTKQYMTTILLIEDYYDNARLVMRSLKPYGYRLIHAADGESGYQMALDEKPDLILLDLGLPDVEGQTLAALLKRQPELSDIPLIAVTAWPPDTAERMARAYGCDGYISKPISPRSFPSQIAAYLTPGTDV